MVLVTPCSIGNLSVSIAIALAGLSSTEARHLCAHHNTKAAGCGQSHTVLTLVFQAMGGISIIFQAQQVAARGLSALVLQTIDNDNKFSKVFVRLLQRSGAGICSEADQRHADFIISDLTVLAKALWRQRAIWHRPGGH